MDFLKKVAGMVPVIGGNLQSAIEVCQQVHGALDTSELDEQRQHLAVNQEVLRKLFDKYRGRDKELTEAIGSLLLKSLAEQLEETDKLVVPMKEQSWWRAKASDLFKKMTGVTDKLRAANDALAKLQPLLQTSMLINIHETVQGGEQHYIALLSAALMNGAVDDNERSVLKGNRAIYSISEIRHVELLGKLGWTLEQYDRGYKTQPAPHPASPLPSQPAVVQQTVTPPPAPSSPTPPPPQPAVVHVPPGTTLHSAAQGGNTEHVRALLDRGGEVDGRDELQSTPLHYAAYFGHTDTARLLLDRGADVNAKNVFQATPLHDAASIGRTDTARLLLDRGADVNAKDKDQWTPLHNAAYFGHTDTARLLLDRGADVNAKDRDGKTPLKIAIDRNKSEVAALLRARGGLQ